MKFAEDTEWIRIWNRVYDTARISFGTWESARLATVAVDPDFPVEKMGFDLLCKKRGWK